MSRFVELHDLAVQRNVQSSSRDRDLNVIRVRSLVSVPDRFHVYAPIPHDGFGVDYVSKMWPHEKLSVVGGGKRRGVLGMAGVDYRDGPATFQFGRADQTEVQ